MQVHALRIATRFSIATTVLRPASPFGLWCTAVATLQLVAVACQAMGPLGEEGEPCLLAHRGPCSATPLGFDKTLLLQRPEQADVVSAHSLEEFRPELVRTRGTHSFRRGSAHGA